MNTNLITQLEDKRKKVLRQRLGMGFAYISTVIVACIVFARLSPDSMLISAIFWITQLVILVIVTIFMTRTWFTPQEEHQLFLQEIQNVFTQKSSYEAQEGFTEKTIRSLNFFRYFSEKSIPFFEPTPSYQSKDRVELDYKGIQCVAASAHLKYTTSNGQSSTTHEMFRGIILKAKYPWDFEGATQVYPRSYEYAIPKGQSVRLESTDFMNTYKVYSTNQVGARMALMTDTIDTILQLKKSTQLTPYFLFQKELVWIFIPNTAWLDISIFTPIPKKIETIRVLLEHISTILTSLKLHYLGNKKNR